MENRNGGAGKTSIARRWITNSVGLLLLIVAILVVALSFAVQGYVYNGIQSALNGRSDELTNVFSSYGRKSASDFLTAARSYVEDFPNKESMELMVINQAGKVVTTSIGFAPDQSQHDARITRYALASPNDYGTWTGKLKSGERVMAVTRVIRNESGSPVGAIRYVVSLEEADKQIFTIVAALVLAGAIVLLFAVVSSHYFIRSILTPIRQIGATAKLIAQGDFKARIVKTNNDELGELCDTINDMADELGQNEKMKNDFISSVSHELRTPLTAIKGWAETIQSGETDPETFHRGMGIIVSETERLSGIVEELLDFSRMQSGRMTLTMDRIDLLAELGAAVYMFSERARSEHKFLVYDEPAMLPPVLGDINRLRQVFVNVLDNALKYTQEGGTINVTAEEEGGFIRVVIADDGCGIPAEHLPNVKKKFYKANQTVRGSGIGLALADEIMTLHSGSLDIDSHENVGTVVTIRIPTFRQLENNTARNGKGRKEYPMSREKTKMHHIHRRAGPRGRHHDARPEKDGGRRAHAGREHLAGGNAHRAPAAEKQHLAAAVFPRRSPALSIRLSSVTGRFRCSVEKSVGEDGDEEEESKFDRWIEEKFGDKTMNVISGVGSVLGIVLAIALFFVFPTWLFNLIQGAAGPSHRGVALAARRRDAHPDFRRLHCPVRRHAGRAARVRIPRRGAQDDFLL